MKAPNRTAKACTKARQPKERQPAQRSILSRDDLSFTQRDREGRLLNWFVPSRNGNWHEHYGIGEAWFSEVVELARNNPRAAYEAMLCAGTDSLRMYGSFGHADGFMDHMARWALAAMLTNAAQPELPFEPLRLGVPPREGMDFYRSKAVPCRVLSPSEQEAIDRQAWQKASESLWHLYQRFRADLMEQQA